MRTSTISDSSERSLKDFPGLIDSYNTYVELTEYVREAEINLVSEGSELPEYFVPRPVLTTVAFS